jgi:type I restriction enzyme S subunit
VAKIDELMARCDELEKLRVQRDQQRITVHRAAIARLLDTTTQPATADFSEAWQFITHHFGDLYTVKANVAELRKAILRLAVMGKLVPQDPNDSPASELFQKIDAPRTKLLTDRKVVYRQVSELPEIDAMKYNIPDCWLWARFKDVVFFQEGPGIRKWQFTNEGVKLLNVSNILFDGTTDFSNSDKYVGIDEFLEKYTHFEVTDGDLLFASSGGSWGKIAWFSDPGFRVMLNTSTIRLRFFDEKYEPDYLYFFLKSDFFRRQMSPQLVGMQPNFGSTHLSRIYIPLPPLPEQHRIVAKIDQLMALCDQLEANIDTATHQQTKLLHAVMAEV